MRTRIVQVAMLACLAGAAQADITITSGELDVFCNGTVGRQGSTSGLITDDPAMITGTSGLLTLGAHVAGGPVPPGGLPTLPGTSARFDAAANGHAQIQGDPAGRIITHDLSVTNALDDMDGPGLSATANANAVSRVYFTLSAPTPYVLEGIAAFDDEDAGGFIRLGTIFAATRFVTRASNGPFAFTGTLAAGNYYLHTTINVSATAGAAGVPFSGAFGESGSAFVVLTLGTPPPSCDPDVNADGNIDQDDIDYLINVVGGGPNTSGADPDFNADGNVDQGDVDALINVVAGGACP